jgi:hypothetical protein
MYELYQRLAAPVDAKATLGIRLCEKARMRTEDDCEEWCDAAIFDAFSRRAEDRRRTEVHAMMKGGKKK